MPTLPGVSGWIANFSLRWRRKLRIAILQLTNHSSITTISSDSSYICPMKMSKVSSEILPGHYTI